MSGIVLLVLRTYIQMVHSSLKRLGRSLSVWVSMILLVLICGSTSGSNVTILEKSQYVGGNGCFLEGEASRDSAGI